MNAPRNNEKQEPRLDWDGSKHRWDVLLPLQDEAGNVVKANWNQNVWTVLRIRKQAQGSEWSPGFETPISSIMFSDFDPCTVYELEMWHRNSAGNDGPRKIFKIRTDENGHPTEAGAL